MRITRDDHQNCACRRLSGAIIAARDEVHPSCTNRVATASRADTTHWLQRLSGRCTPAARKVAALPGRTHARSIEELVAAGQLVLLHGRPSRPQMGVQPRRVAAPPEELTNPLLTRCWIAFQVIHHTTGQPIPGVRLSVRTPGGAAHEYETDLRGLVEIDEIRPGTCDVWSPLLQPRLARTVAFVDLAPAAGPRAGRSASASGSYSWLAHVDEHKVRTGETLASIAASAGMRWQDLALFNWGTANPDEINRHLADDVGCTLKTPDGFNYVFTSEDEPGIVSIPRPWAVTGLATEQTHVIRVKLAAGVRLVLENQDGLRIPEAEYRATLADGSVRQGRLGRSGIARIADPPPGRLEIVYPDLDDIEAKSLAACARKAMDDRDLSEVFRVLKHSREMIHDVVAMYDRYYNDYTGRGLLADIDQEAAEPDDRAPIEALLRIAALRPEPGDSTAIVSSPESQAPNPGISPHSPETA
ncbi:MAG: hypothetical protein AMXMBFR47_15290 [Planctomycetota bacterium]